MRLFASAPLGRRLAYAVGVIARDCEGNGGPTAVDVSRTRGIEFSRARQPGGVRGVGLGAQRAQLRGGSIGIGTERGVKCRVIAAVGDSHRRAGPGQLADGIGAIRARGIEECGALLLVACVDGCTMREQQREQLGVREFCRLHERGDSEAVGAAHVAPVVDQVLRRRQRIRGHRVRQHRRAEGVAERGDAVTERMRTGDIAVARPEDREFGSQRSVAQARPLRTERHARCALIVDRGRVPE